MFKFLVMLTILISINVFAIDEDGAIGSVSDNETIISFKKQIEILQHKDKELSIKLYKTQYKQEECENDKYLNDTTRYPICRNKYESEINALKRERESVQKDIRYLLDNKEKTLDKLDNHNLFVQKSDIVKKLNNDKNELVNEINWKHEDNVKCIRQAIDESQLIQCKNKFEYQLKVGQR